MCAIIPVDEGEGGSTFMCNSYIHKHLVYSVFLKTENGATRFHLIMTKHQTCIYL